MLSRYVLAVFIFLNALVAWSSPTQLTYQGRILKTDGTPLEFSNVSFIFQVMDPAGTCLIYQEQVTGYNMANSGGVFDIAIGNGSIQYPLSGTFSILDAFNNSVAFTCGSCSLVGTTYTCVNGSGTYSASGGDNRKLRVSFYDGSGWRLISPDNVIRSVPFAGYSLSAQKLGTNVASDFLLKAGLPTCGVNTFLAWNGSSLSCEPVAGAAGGTVTNVSGNAPISVVNNTSTPVISIAQATGASSGYLSSADWNIFNGKQPAGNYITALTGDVTAAGPGSASATVTSVGGSSAVNIHSAELAANAATNLNTPSTLVKRDASGSFSAGTITANLTGNVTGNVTGNITGNVTGSASLNVLKSGDVMSGNLTFGSGKGVVFTDAIANTVSLQAPSSVTSYVLKLPAAQGTANQLLTNDGAGNLNWTSLSALGVPSVAVTSPIINSGTSTAPNIGIQQANGSQSGYLSSADWSAFNGKLGANLSSGNIWVGNGTNVATAVVPGGDVTMTNVGSFTVSGLRGKAVSATLPSSAGQVLRYDGAGTYVPGFLSLADIRSTVTPGNTMFPATSCTAGQTLNWSSLTDTMSCVSIAVTPANFANQAQNTILAGPASGGSGAPSFRALASSDLPVGGYDSTYFKNGGNSFGGAATLGTNDANTLSFKTGGATAMTIDATGKVGIGTASPGSPLTVNGLIQSTTGGIKFPDGTVQATAASGTIGMQTKIGSFSSPAATGNYSVTGLGFSPSLVRFNIQNNRTGSMTGVSTTVCSGTMTSTAQNASYAYANTTVVRNLIYTDRVLACSPIDATLITLQASYVSMDPDGFTINFTATSSGWTITWEAIGGSTASSSGSGTTNYIPVWTSSTGLGSSPIAINGASVGIGTATPQATLDVNGSISSQGPAGEATSGAVSAGTGGGTVVTGYSVSYSVGSGFNASAGSFQPTVAGRYLLTANAYSSTNCSWSVSVCKNTSCNRGGPGVSVPGNGCLAAISKVVNLNGSTDYAGVQIMNYSGSAISVNEVNLTWTKLP